jgi:hypothetical protein
MKTLNDFNFQDKKALIRVDFNVPLNDNFEVTDATRIVSAKPTIIKILEDGGSCVLMSHLGRPKGVQDEYSLKHIIPKIEDILGVEVKFASDCVGSEAEEKANALQPGEILLLENLRFHEEEKKGDKGFAEQLSKLGAENIILDPGLGFGKSLECNYELLKNIGNVRVNNLPILAGISRKSMINKVLNIIPEKALTGTIALNTIALLSGANILRVHDVKEATEVVRIMEFIKKVEC